MVKLRATTRQQPELEHPICRAAGDAWLNLGRLLGSNLSLNTTAEQTRPALVGHWLSPSETVTGICPGSSPGSLRHRSSPVAASVHAGPSCRLAGATVPAPTRSGSAPPPRHGPGPRLPLSGRRTGSDPRPSDLAQCSPAAASPSAGHLGRQCAGPLASGGPPRWHARRRQLRPSRRRAVLLSRKRGTPSGRAI